MSDLTIFRGRPFSLPFAILASDGTPYPLAGTTLRWYATNLTQTLEKTLLDGITVDSPSTLGTGKIEGEAIDTATWPDSVAPLTWELELTDGGETFPPVATGTLWFKVALPASLSAGDVHVPYFSKDDLAPVITNRLLARLSADTGDSADDAIISGVIALVCSEMDKLLRRVMAVPVTAPADLMADLKTTGVQMAPYYFYLRKGINENEAAAAAAMALWRSALKGLEQIVKDIADGKRGLTGDPIVPSSIDPEEHWGSEEPLFMSPAMDGDSEGS